MEITTQQLLAIEPGVIFYEVDLPAMPLYQKVGNSSDGRDVIVCPLADEEEEQMRLGLAEMGDVERNSKRWHVCEPKELERMIERLSEGAFAFPEAQRDTPRGRTVTPAAVPSDALIREWEDCESRGLHVRPITDGEPGYCWCGEMHNQVREIHITQNRKGESPNEAEI